jgi:hypothetical protein
MHPIGSRNQGGIQQESPRRSSNQRLRMLQTLAIHNQPPPLFRINKNKTKQNKTKQKIVSTDELAKRRKSF